jgi:hypothetical protein
MPSVTRSVGQTRLIKTFSFTVAVSTTENYIYSTVANFRSTKFFVEIVEDTTGEVSTFTANVSNTSTNDPDDTIFGKVGDKLKYTFNVLKSGSDIVIQVTNNEGNLLTVNVIRITF